jgi:hypothetical protein
MITCKASSLAKVRPWNYHEYFHCFLKLNRFFKLLFDLLGSALVCAVLWHYQSQLTVCLILLLRPKQLPLPIGYAFAPPLNKTR